MPEHIFDEDRSPEKAPENNAADDLMFSWNSEMGQITGFVEVDFSFGDMSLRGIDYENECRRMVEHAVSKMTEWFGLPPDIEPNHDAAVDYIVGRFYDGDQDLFKEEILEALSEGAKESPTGAQVSASYAHAMLIWQFGWDDYERSMRAWKDHPVMKDLYKAIQKL